MALVAGGRYAIFRQHFNAVRTSVFLDTLPTVMKVCFPGQPVDFNRSDSVLSFPSTGGEIWCLGLDDAERVEKILGKEFAAIYFNECSEISFHAVETALTRVSQRPEKLNRNKVLYDCNPPSKSHWAHRLFIEKTHPESRELLPNPNSYVSIKINPLDNKANLPPDYIDQTLNGLSLAKRKRFLLGEWMDDNENALWKSSTMIDPFRCTHAPDNLERIVVGVDPAVTNAENSDYTGIVVAGKRRESDGIYHYYVISDRSMKSSPRDWANAVCNAYRGFNADRVIAETNQGGDLVASTLYTVNQTIPIRKVHAKRGKLVRAEPVAALYERGLVHHVGEFDELESELTSYTGSDTEKSPDRMDALVWAMTDLMESNSIKKGVFF